VQDGEALMDKEMADSHRWYLRSRNIFVAGTADFLDAHVHWTPIWLVWKWEGEPLSRDCARWTRTPSYFRQPDFTMPTNEGVIAIAPD
jgi:hypothetical protein